MSSSCVAPERSLATDAAGIRRRMEGFATAEGIAKGKSYKPSPTDLFIATYPKCGTTLMQQIVHGLRSGGDMDFSEITEVVPWIELADDVGLDLATPENSGPRAFKTHLDWHQVPKGGRYIYIVRDPRDVVVSFFHFLKGWFFEAGSVDLEEFALGYVLQGSRSGRYWEHLVSWWPKRLAADTLFLSFEDMLEDLAGTVARVAAFIEVPQDAARLERATQQATFEFMRAHGDQFDDHLVQKARNKACGLPADAISTKVRKGRAGEHEKDFPAAVAEAWEKEWREVVEPATGFDSYESLRRSLQRLGVCSADD